MASQALTLYNKERALSFAREYLRREEAQSISMAPLAIMPLLFSNGYSNRGDTIKLKTTPTKSVRKAQPKKTTGGTTINKRAAYDIGGPSKRTLGTSSGSTPSHLSSSFWSAKLSFPYTVVGVDKSDGGHGKGLMAKKVPKPQIRGQPTGFFEDVEPPQPMEPTMTSLNKQIKALSGRIRYLQGRLVEGYTTKLHLEEEISSLHLSFYEELARIAKAVGVEHALPLSC
jgi:hypothetical protein